MVKPVVEFSYLKAPKTKSIKIDFFPNKLFTVKIIFLGV